MKIRQLLQVLPVIFFLLGTSRGFSSELLREEMQSGSFNREYFVHLPAGYRKVLATAVVLVFHGGGGNAEQIAKFSGFNTLSEKHGFLAIYPQAIDNHGNDGRNSEKFREHDTRIHDVARIKKLLGELKRTYSIDTRRVYATGISNGGIFSQRLAIELGQHFAAVASLTAQIAEPLAKTNPTSPVSMLIINGTKDPFVPLEGGDVTPYLFPRFRKLLRQSSRGKVISTEDTIAFWVRHHRIGGTGTVKKLPDIDTTDESTVERTEWIKEKPRASVVLDKIIGGRHIWSGPRDTIYPFERWARSTRILMLPPRNGSGITKVCIRSSRTEKI